ncbi:hypothetical protein BSK61_09035 [Paenibacillus odorifer]|nr:hypothetical protein PODO_21340 [Paenibacillus odorifer]OME25731.1 hypothetical protein BSK57_11430 [Paenibacillus odorifer]OME43890.1 hypothetical protein BSK58_05725 [Paenibacillus odorifer]OME57967.1 hypothetical protein BSK61_09035 [Paenibacillus odorifer]
MASLRFIGTGCFFDNWISGIYAGYARMNTLRGKRSKSKNKGVTQKVSVYGEQRTKARSLRYNKAEARSLRCAKAKVRSLRYAKAKVRQQRRTLGKFGSDELLLSRKFVLTDSLDGLGS